MNYPNAHILRGGYLVWICTTSFGWFYPISVSVKFRGGVRCGPLYEFVRPHSDDFTRFLWVLSLGAGLGVVLCMNLYDLIRRFSPISVSVKFRGGVRWGPLYEFVWPHSDDFTRFLWVLSLGAGLGVVLCMNLYDLIRRFSPISVSVKFRGGVRCGPLYEFVWPHSDDFTRFLWVLSLGAGFGVVLWMNLYDLTRTILPDFCEC